ncbi:hypothetical protein PV327_004641 [Microctonus hyperodae]|uniref:Peptidase S1 domain-containing protein n=1 Tax=Microctonus hyperodae TaxID=165561 RepID=A0AA39FCV0_MICHY|nr:hypothetical protein PV327_004641 [Microctonus hyperodae]
MSLFQLSLILHLFLHVYGADEFSSSTTTTTTTNDHRSNRNRNSTNGINRIVGGSPTTIKQYPFMANNPYLMVAVAGTTSLEFTSTWQIQNIDQILPHNGYNGATMAHDIALLRIFKPFRITPYVTYARLPDQTDEDLVKRQPMCEVLGWGKTHSSSPFSDPPSLHRASVPLMPSSQCSQYAGYQNILPDHICAGFEAGGVDACQGDSGGPLLCDGIQVGVISWGLGCAAPQAPGVYGRVDIHLSWINQTIMRSNATLIISSRFIVIMLFIAIWSLSYIQ